MIKLSYQKFMGFTFQQAVQKLSGYQMPPQIAYKVKKMVDALEREQKKIRTEYSTLIKTYARKDEKGEIIRPEPKDPNSFDIPDDQVEAYKKAEEAFGESTFEVDRPKLNLLEIPNIQFSPAELSVLEPLLQDPEQAEAQAAAKVVPLKGGA